MNERSSADQVTPVFPQSALSCTLSTLGSTDDLVSKRRLHQQAYAVLGAASPPAPEMHFVFWLKFECHGVLQIFPDTAHDIQFVAKIPECLFADSYVSFHLFVSLMSCIQSSLLFLSLFFLFPRPTSHRPLSLSPLDSFLTYLLSANNLTTHNSPNCSSYLEISATLSAEADCSSKRSSIHSSTSFLASSSPMTRCPKHSTCALFDSTLRSTLYGSCAVTARIPRLCSPDRYSQPCPAD